MYRNKVAVITGAGSGIGRELARALAAEGARLALSDRDAPGLAETARLCSGAEVRSYVLDVADRAAVARHAREIEADFGAAHFLFNNAGVALVATVEHMSIEEAEWVFAINLWGVVYGTKAFLPLMLRQREGCIVNVSSVFGFVAVPTQSAYCMAKFAVRAFTETLWQELTGTGVRAVSVHPGGIRTGIGTSARLGAAAGERERRVHALVPRALVTPPEDCARAILAGVAAGRSRIVTGSNGRLTEFLSRLFPVSYGRILRRFM
jgi:NAD(P)-dependent dehydrogenase (short-subunit alcohol dehydrogenase family)